MEYPVVLRVKPIDTPEALDGAHKHQLRERDEPELHIDAARTKFNRTLFGTGNIRSDVESQVAKWDKAHARTTTCAEMVLTANADWFDQISPGWRENKISPKMQQWIDLNMSMLREKYPGLASVTLHLDEVAPHIHALIVPVATYDISFRRGSKTVTRIAYNKVFGDDAQVIAKARKTGNSELTKLGRLQTEYAKVMKPVGLVRGVRNSKAEHVTPSEHRQAINTPLPALPAVKTVVPSKTSSDAVLEAAGITTQRKRLEDKRNAEVRARLKAERKQLDQLRQRSIEFDKLKPIVQQQKELLMEKDEIILALQAKVAELDKDISVAKSTVDALRKTPLHDIAERLEYDGPMQWKGAIDMVKELGKLSYADAVAWLYHEFGEGVAVAAAVDETARMATAHVARIARDNAPRPMLAHELVKQEAITKQLDGLQADRYRITLMGEEAGLPSYNLGKPRDKTAVERFYSKDEILSYIPLLSRENARGYNVFVTPFSDTKHYILVDDLSDGSYDKLLADGFTPSVVLQSSPKSKQAVLVIPDPEHKEAKPVLNALFTDVNRTYGDPNIQAQVHPFRLAGFTNRKQKHVDPSTGRSPFVLLLKHAHVLCKATTRLLDAIRAATTLAPRPTATAKREVAELIDALDMTQRVAIPTDLVATATRFYQWINDRYGPSANLSVADWMLSQRLRKAGHGDEMIARVLLSHSPNIEARHADAGKYARRTLAELARREGPK